MGDDLQRCTICYPRVAIILLLIANAFRLNSIENLRHFAINLIISNDRINCEIFKKKLSLFEIIMASLDEQFGLFSKFGDTKSDGKTITLTQIDKWFKQAAIFDKKLTTTDTAIAFNKFKYNHWV